MSSRTVSRTSCKPVASRMNEGTACDLGPSSVVSFRLSPKLTVHMRITSFALPASRRACHRMHQDAMIGASLKVKQGKPCLLNKLLKLLPHILLPFSERSNPLREQI